MNLDYTKYFEPGHEDTKKLTHDDFLIFEQKYNIQLPEAYKATMIKQNGGSFIFRNDENDTSVYFCSLDEFGNPTAPMIDSFWSFEFITEFSFDLVKEDQMPSSLLIIGEACDTTSYLCLGVLGDIFGKVYTWTKREHTDMWSDYDLDIPYIEKGEMRDRSVKVADSIRELLDGLCTYHKAQDWAPNEFEWIREHLKKGNES
jgi:hypothetical protein